MGICPVCGTFIDPGEPYCHDCGHIVSENSSSPISINNDSITIDGIDYDIDELEEALEEWGYDLDDLESGSIDDDELEKILEACKLLMKW